MPGFLSLADLFDRFGASPGYAALSTVASLLIIPLVLISGGRGVMGWWRGRQRHSAVDYLARCTDRVPALSEKLEGADDPGTRAEASRLLTDAVGKTERYVSLTQGKALRQAASLPANGKVTGAQVESPLAGYESMPSNWHVQQRIRRLADRIRTMLSEGTI